MIRIALALLGLLFIFVGSRFLIDPATMGASFALSCLGNGGLSNIRADMTAFFWVWGGALLIGVWQQLSALFCVMAALMGIVVTIRCFSLAVDGTYEGWHDPSAA